MTKEELIKQANDWANDFWDESNLHPDDRTDKSTIDLAVTSGAIGYVAGVEAALALGRRQGWDARVPGKAITFEDVKWEGVL